MEPVALFHLFSPGIQINQHTLRTQISCTLALPFTFCVDPVNKHKAERECTGKQILHLNTKLISFLSYYIRLKKARGEEKIQCVEITLEIAEIFVYYLCDPKQRTLKERLGHKVQEKYGTKTQNQCSQVGQGPLLNS